MHWHSINEPWFRGTDSENDLVFDFYNSNAFNVRSSCAQMVSLTLVWVSWMRSTRLIRGGKAKASTSGLGTFPHMTGFSVVLTANLGGISDLAVQHGVTISIIGIKGQDCRMEQLGALAEKTNGVVNIVGAQFFSFVELHLT